MITKLQTWLKHYRNRLRAFVSCLRVGNFYSIRRAFVWPEGKYKRGMIRRVQKIYKYPYFVETGTYLGETPLVLRGDFEHLWTIELDEALFEKAKNLLQPYPHIFCIRGDSKEVLGKLAPQLDKPTIFWLDAHYSGAGTAHGEVKTPLVQELQAINLSPIKSHIIIIDDISDFSATESNVPLSQVIRLLEKINSQYKYYFDYDMLFALPFENQHRGFWRKIAYPVVVR